jgi:hypothetical protein
MLIALNYMLHTVHVAFILFVMTAWIFPPLRIAHIVVCGLTLISWFAIGLAIGRPGFCIITEIQFWVRNRLGIQQERKSYILYLLEKLFCKRFSPHRIEVFIQCAFYFFAALSVGLTWFA